MIREVVADIFLVMAVVIVLASSVGVLVMGDVYQKIHFVTPAALVAPVLVTLAVFVHAGFSATTTEALIVLVFMVIAGPFLSHATIRAARIREKGDWRPGRAAGADPDGRAGGDGSGGGDGRAGGVGSGAGAPSREGQRPG
jgi:monovalent cation/proton antiporter MnhG/PhaG subunit